MRADENQYTQSMPWPSYPIGTRVFMRCGGYYEKTEKGYKWMMCLDGSIFDEPDKDFEYILTPTSSN